jgi:hypothetical protein
MWTTIGIITASDLRAIGFPARASRVRRRPRLSLTIEKIPMIGYTDDVRGWVSAIPVNSPGSARAPWQRRCSARARPGPIAPGRRKPCRMHSNEPEPRHVRTNPKAWHAWQSDPYERTQADAPNPNEPERSRTSASSERAAPSRLRSGRACCRRSPAASPGRRL